MGKGTKKATKTKIGFSLPPSPPLGPPADENPSELHSSDTYGDESLIILPQYNSLRRLCCTNLLEFSEASPAEQNKALQAISQAKGSLLFLILSIPMPIFFFLFS